MLLNQYGLWPCASSVKQILQGTHLHNNNFSKIVDYIKKVFIMKYVYLN
jgi:hypothetical protein